MKFGEFKQNLKIITRGDISMPSDDELKLVMSEVARNIHANITPLEKIEIDHRAFEVDYYIDEKNFVRGFATPFDDDSDVDFFDEMLLRALIYGVAYKRSLDEKRALKYQKNYLKALGDYEICNFGENCKDLESALNLRGFKKPYAISYALDKKYIWDEEFIKNLDFFMANVEKSKSLSYRNFIYLFIEYQNNADEIKKFNQVANFNNPKLARFVRMKFRSNRDDMADLDKLLSLKIKGI